MWVEVVTDPLQPPVRLQDQTVALLKASLDRHRPGPPSESVGVGVGRGNVSVELQQQWSIASVALLGALLVGGTVLTVLARRTNRRARTALALARHTAESREEERTRVAREIHDGPLQDLALLARMTGEPRGATSGGSAAPVDVQAHLRAVGADLRALAADLRPPALDQLGLAAALADLSDRWATAPVPLTVRVVDEHAGRLSAEVELALYRITQEALANASAHGQARTAWVFLRGGVGAPSELVVRDDGTGIPSTLSTGGSGRHQLVAGGHFGLAGMDERARAVRGRLTVGSGPGGVGTEVYVRLAGTPSTGRTKTQLGSPTPTPVTHAPNP